MKFPKLRDGPNALGEALFRALQKSSSPFISAEGINYGANKMGNSGEVYGGLEDGFYSLGSLEPDPDTAPYKVVASNSARGSFLSRGPWDGGTFSNPVLFYIGAGSAIVPSTNGSVSPVTLATTKNGKTFKDVLTFSFSVSPYAQFVWRLHSPALAVSDGEAKWNWAVSYWKLTESGGVRTATAVYRYTKDSGETFTEKSISLGPRALIGEPNSFRVSAQNILCVIPYYVVGEGVPPPNDYWDPQSDWRSSLALLITGNGDSQDILDGGDLMAMLELSVTDIVTDPIEAAIVNARLEEWAAGIQVIPLIDGSVLVTAYAQFYDGRYSGGTATDTGVWTFRFDGVTFSFVSKVAIPSIDTLALNFILLDETPVAVARPQSSTELARFAVADETGTSWTYKLMPYPKRYIGGLSAIDKKTVICPMYNPDKQAYVLMQTKDLGDTWTQRATIAKNVPAPDIADGGLRRFAAVAYLRKDGLPAKSYPGAPWIGDDRITPPWET